MTYDKNIDWLCIMIRKLPINPNSINYISHIMLTICHKTNVHTTKKTSYINIILSSHFNRLRYWGLEVSITGLSWSCLKNWSFDILTSIFYASNVVGMSDWSRKQMCVWYMIFWSYKLPTKICRIVISLYPAPPIRSLTSFVQNVNDCGLSRSSLILSLCAEMRREFAVVNPASLCCCCLKSSNTLNNNYSWLSSNVSSLTSWTSYVLMQTVMSNSLVILA